MNLNAHIHKVSPLVKIEKNSLLFASRVKPKEMVANEQINNATANTFFTPTGFDNHMEIKVPKNIPKPGATQMNKGINFSIKEAATLNRKKSTFNKIQQNIAVWFTESEEVELIR